MRPSPAGPRRLGILALATVVASLTMVGSAGAADATFSNGASIALADNMPAATYPSAITAAGLCGTVSKATVTLTNLTHGSSKDLDMMLVAPSGTKILMLSDAGGNAAGVTLTLDDAAAASVPVASISSGTFRPSNYADTGGSGDDAFPAGLPAGPVSGTSLAGLFGTAPNGAWRLFIRDDDAGLSGTLAGGWSLRLQTTCPVVPGGDPFDDGEGGLDPDEDGLSPPLTGPGARLPAMSRLKLSPARFKASKKGGTKVSFTLSRAGSVTFGVERRTNGRKSGKKCVARKKSNRKKKACTRWVKVKGSFTIGGKAGANSFAFRGKIGSKRLAPGRYRLNGNAAAVERSSFTVVR